MPHHLCLVEGLGGIHELVQQCGREGCVREADVGVSSVNHKSNELIQQRRKKRVGDKLPGTPRKKERMIKADSERPSKDRKTKSKKQNCYKKPREAEPVNRLKYLQTMVLHSCL